MNATTSADGVFIDGNWFAGEGDSLVSTNPADQSIVWSGRMAAIAQAVEAINAADRAWRSWRDIDVNQRQQIVQAFAAQLRQRQDELATLIAQETGKPLWDSRGEVTTCIAKVDLTLKAYSERRQCNNLTIGNTLAELTYRPLGVVVVLGPFNFPAHLPGGQIIPALLAGNAVVFKPSELTPAVGGWITEAWHRAGLPQGVLNMVQGDAAIAAALIDQPQVRGVMFTGSHRAGKSIHQRLAGRTDVLLALEMGGNNPLVVLPPYDNPLYAGLTVQSAFVTAGQRCTCARRLIVLDTKESQDFLDHLVARTGKLRCGVFSDDPEPFIGPVISVAAADRLLETQAQWQAAGGVSLLTMNRSDRCPALLSPGIIDMTAASSLAGDDEHFGPLLQVVRVADWESAIRQAAATRFGLAAALIGGTREQFEQFRRGIPAGVVNWNRQTTGASGALPFGGLGDSGNHRPAGFWAIDACSDPVAGLIAEAIHDEGFDRSQL
jgi:succinylglutamic semialdehyde dehydrogenase